MSTIKLNGSSSGNAQITVAAAAGTPTITLPTASIDLSTAGTDGQFLKTNGSGTLSFADAPAGGKILQAVTASDDAKATTSSTFADIYDSALSITLASTSNKVFALHVTSYAFMSASSGQDIQADYKLVRSTSGDTNDNLQTGRMRLQSGTDMNCTMVVSALDSSFSNLANTYNVQIRYHSGNESAEAKNNRLYLFEVAA